MSVRLAQRSERRPIARSRAISILLGILYIYIVTWLLAAATRSSFPVVAVVVSAGAIIEMLIIGELSRRYYLRQSGDKRFGLGTLFLVTIGLSIYLAAFSFLVRNLPIDSADLSWQVATLLCGLGLLFTAASTMALTNFAEALVWIGILVATSARSRRK